MADTWEFDPAANSWSQRASIPTPRIGAAAAVLGGRIHVLGGDITRGAIPEALRKDKKERR